MLMCCVYVCFAKEEYEMWCEVRYDDDYGHQAFQEQVATDGKTYERLEVPEMGDFRRATILHDFESVSAPRSHSCVVFFHSFTDMCLVLTELHGNRRRHGRQLLRQAPRPRLDQTARRLLGPHPENPSA